METAFGKKFNPSATVPQNVRRLMKESKYQSVVFLISLNAPVNQILRVLCQT